MKKTLYNLFASCILSAAITTSTEAQTIYTFCGSSAGFSGDGGPATAATIQNPAAIKYKSGEIYFVDAGNHRIRKISASPYTINTFLGDGTSGFSGDGGSATTARINSGSFGGGMVFDNSNNMYYADILNHRIRKINSSGIISTIAGSSAGYSGDGGPASAARLSYPIGMAIDANGNLYVADQGNNRIRKIDIASGIISTIAGTGTSDNTGDGGLATAADISNPHGVAIDDSGNVYFSKVGGIRKITAATGIVTTIASIGATETPAFMELDRAGNLFVGTEDNTGRLYKVTPSGVTTVVAGNGSAIAAGDGGPATAAAIGNCAGVTVSATGDLLITSKNNHRIRIILANTALLSGTATVCAGGTTTFTASIPDAAWISGDTSVATVSASGVITGVSAGTAAITYVAGLVFGTRVVTVNAPTAPSISAAGATLSVPSTFATYQWKLGGTPIAGATNNTHTATTSGTYAVDVTDAGGCSATSADFAFTASVGDVNKTTALQLFPNPAADGAFAVSIAGSNNEEVAIVITNATGMKVYETTTKYTAPMQVKINVPAGVYMLHATTATQQYNTKVMVK